MLLRTRFALWLALLAACDAPSESLPHGDTRQSCGGCHVGQLDSFESSAHARSSRSPVLVAMLPRVEDAWGPTARARCEACHAPAHTSRPDLDIDVTCISCHAAVGNRAERDGRLVLDPSLGMAGPSGDADTRGAHGTRPSTFLASPSLCGTCHEVTGPELFVEPTLTEHLESPAFADGEHCIDCHMRPIDPAPVAASADLSRARRDHHFVGIDPPWGASAGDALEAAARTRALLASALVLRSRAVHGGIEIQVENTARGHDVPTGISMLRDVGVDASWIDAAGVSSSPVRVLELADQPTRRGALVALPTDADSVERRRLAPGERRRVRIEAPAGATSVELTLTVRAFRADVLAALGLSARASEVPVHVLAVERLQLAE